MSKRLGGDFKSGIGDPAQVVEELHLAQRSQTQVVRQVMRVEAEVTARPADSAARDRETRTGSTRELRTSGVTAVFASPIGVGSFFQLSFDPRALDLAPVFARCERCSLLAEHEFEARFYFLQTVILPNTGAGPAD